MPPQALLPIGGYSSVVEHPAAIRQVLGSTPSVPFSFARIHFLAHHTKKHGPNGDLNPGPPAPKAGIIPLDHLATTDLCLVGTERHRKENENKKQKTWFGSGGIRTHAPEETGALNQRLRPLGHATFLLSLLETGGLVPVAGQLFTAWPL